MPDPGPSEFAGRGVHRSGVVGLHWAWEKARFMRRTEKDPEQEPERLDASPDEYLKGGVTKDNWKNIRG
jgi:hypothetical protein